MSENTTIEDLTHLRYQLEVFLLAGAFELVEDMRPVATVETRCATAEIMYGKLILTCWGDGWSRSWRVLRAEADARSLQLACSRQMGRVISTLELRRDDGEGEKLVPREQFAGKLAALVETGFTSMKVGRAVLRRDDRRSFSGIHARLELLDRDKVVAGIGVSGRELQDGVDATLGAGLVWLEELRRRRGLVDRLMIFVPAGRGDTIAARMTALRIPGATVSLHEVDEKASAITPLAPFDQGDLNDRQRRAAMRAEWPHEQQLPLDAMMLVDSLQRLSPDVVRAHRRGAWVLVSIRGLEFARVSLRRRVVEFGVGPVKEKLKHVNQGKLEALVKEIVAARRPDPADLNSLLYREQGERWLEAVLEADITAIDPTLDRRYVYSQVPAYRGEQRSFIDLLTATRDGRLVVIELKVAEDPEFPYQGLDYWLRVEWHRRRGDFARRGYFRELPLRDAPPLLYLVAPVLRFHATTKLIAGTIADPVRVTRIGINDDWRGGVRVLMSEELNSHGVR